jgi:hypothetical protein
MLGGLGLLVAVAIGAAIWVGAFLVGALGQTADTMDPAIIASLANQGITLGAPPTTSVPVGKEQAKVVAFQHFPNSNPSAAILATVVVQWNARNNCTCWVVSWQLRTEVPPYNVTFIDAQSGKYEFAEGSGIPHESGGRFIRPFISKPSPNFPAPAGRRVHPS